MKFIYSLKSTLNNVKVSFTRFPLSMIFAIISSFMVIAVNHTEGSARNRTLGEYALLFIMAVAVYTFVTLFLEGIKIYGKDKEDLKKFRLVMVITYLLSIPLLYGVKANILTYEQNLEGSMLYKYIGLFLFFTVACFFYCKDF